MSILVGLLLDMPQAIVLTTDPAFVYFHPTTFEVIPKDARDVPLYSQFTALKERKQCVPL